MSSEVSGEESKLNLLDLAPTLETLRDEVLKKIMLKDILKNKLAQLAETFSKKLEEVLYDFTILQQMNDKSSELNNLEKKLKNEKETLEQLTKFLSMKNSSNLTKTLPEFPEALRDLLTLQDISKNRLEDLGVKFLSNKEKVELMLSLFSSLQDNHKNNIAFDKLTPKDITIIIKKPEKTSLEQVSLKKSHSTSLSSPKEKTSDNLKSNKGTAVRKSDFKEKLSRNVNGVKNFFNRNFFKGSNSNTNYKLTPITTRSSNLFSTEEEKTFTKKSRTNSKKESPLGTKKKHSNNKKHSENIRYISNITSQSSFTVKFFSNSNNRHEIHSHSTTDEKNLKLYNFHDLLVMTLCIFNRDGFNLPISKQSSSKKDSKQTIINITPTSTSPLLLEMINFLIEQRENILCHNKTDKALPYDEVIKQCEHFIEKLKLEPF